MAKKIEAETTVSEPARIPTEKEFRRLLKKLSDAESELSELKGAMGSAVERAVASHNLHADALRVVRKYIKKNPNQAAEFKLHLDTYWDYQRLGQPEDDLVESPTQRRKRITKTTAEDDAEEDAAPRSLPRGEALGRGTAVIRDGKVTPLDGGVDDEADEWLEQEGATA